MKKRIYPERILQFGGGNFLRAFSNWMVDILNAETQFKGQTIVIKPTPDGDYTDLREQNFQYHINTKGIQDGKVVSEIHLVTSISRVIHPYNEWGDFLSSAEYESIRFIISNTTESGIRYAQEELMENKCPTEFPAKLTMWLYQRWKYFEGAKDKGCIILPCELIEDNAQKLKESIIKHLRSWGLEPGYEDWLHSSNHFCSTLVDRIVPGKPKTPLDIESHEDDALLVMAEPYHLWAIEAPESIRGELPFEETNLNVVFTEDLSRYRKLKVRLLNGAHTGMVPIGYLNGIATVREAVENDKVGRHISDMLYHEIMPTLDLPELEIKEYIQVTLDRFRNPFIDHQLLSISLNSISKFRYRLLPSLIDYIEIFGKIPDQITTSFASLIIFYLGKHKGILIPRRDEPKILAFFDELRHHWEDNHNMEYIITAILQKEDFWGKDLSQIEDLKGLLILKTNEAIDY